MRTIKTILLIIVAGNSFSLLQKAETVSAFTLTVQESEAIFCNTAMIIIAMMLYLALIIIAKVK